MSKITKTTELTDEHLDKVVGGKPDWDGNTTGQNQNLKSQFSRNNLNVNQKTNFFTKLFSIFSVNSNTNNNSITNQYSVTNQNINTNANINSNTNINQNQNEN